MNLLNTKGIVIMSILGIILICLAVFFSSYCKSVSQIIADKDYSEVKDKDLKALLMCGQVFRGVKGAEGSVAVCQKLADDMSEDKREQRKERRFIFCQKRYALALQEKKGLYERALLKKNNCWKSLNEK